MPNYVAMNKDGYIEQTYEGDQTEQTLLDSVTQVITMIEKLHKKHQPVNILVSVAKLGNLSTIARKRTVKMLRDIPYDKVAVYGPSTFNKALINLVIHAAGKHKEVRIFADKAEAQQWLIGKR